MLNKIKNLACVFYMLTFFTTFSVLHADDEGISENTVNLLNSNENIKLSDNPIMFLSDDMLNAIPAVPPPMAEVPLGNSTDIVIYDVQNQEETVILNDNQGNNNEVSGTAEPYTGLLPTTLPSGSESVLGTDGRTQITNTTDFPWRTIVRLSVKYPNSSSIFLCSGSVVDNFHVLTAGHCIHNASLGGWAEVIGVYPGQDGSYTPYYKSNPTNLRSYTGWTSSQSPDHDWGLITLDRNIGAHVGWMGRQTADSTNAIYTGNLNVSGYPGDKPSGTHWYDSDTGHSATDTRHFYFMDTFGGQSGSPVWRYDGTNRYILSIHAYGDYAGTPGVSNGGTRLNTDKYNTLTTWLGSDTAPTDKPDLIDDGNLYSGFSPTSVSAGDSFSAYMDVRNIGTASSGGFYVTFYASTNTTITSGDYYLGQVYVPSISAFQWSDANWSGTFPSGIPAGSYYVGWVIDSGGASNEFDETNNTAYKASPKLTVTASVTTPGAATLVSPSGTITDSTPTYTWNAVSGATYYYLQVNDSTGNVIKTWYSASAAGCSSGTGTCSLTPSTVLASGAGTWWIQTWNSSGFGPWSSGMAFNVSAKPGKATLVSPSGTITDSTPTYSWNAVSGATYYYLYVNDSTGNVIKIWYTAAAAGCSSGTGTCSITPAKVLAGGAGIWWIQTWNSSGLGPWSSGMTFNLL